MSIKANILLVGSGGVGKSSLSRSTIPASYVLPVVYTLNVLKVDDSQNTVSTPKSTPKGNTNPRSWGLGTMVAYNLELGGLALVTSVMRSNYEVVSQNGFTITSLDHGFIRGWKPSAGSQLLNLSRHLLNFPCQYANRFQISPRNISSLSTSS